MAKKFQLILTFLVPSLLVAAVTADFTCTNKCGASECNPSQFCSSMQRLCPMPINATANPCPPVGFCRSITCPTTDNGGACNIQCIDGYICNLEPAKCCKYPVETCVPVVPYANSAYCPLTGCGTTEATPYPVG